MAFREIQRVCFRTVLTEWNHVFIKPPNRQYHCVLRNVSAHGLRGTVDLRQTSSVILTPVRYHMLDARGEDHEKKEKQLIKTSGAQYFDSVEQKQKDKKTFMAAVSKYLIVQGKQRRGHVEFIYASLEHMKRFKVHRDIDAYRQIFDLFPKGKMVAENMSQVEMMHYPKQQQCCIDILGQMEDNGLILLILLRCTFL